MPSLRVRVGAVGAAAFLLLAGPGAPPAVAAPDGHGESTGRRSGGPRTASRTSPRANFAGLGFGVGYVQAEDNICVIAERIVTVDARALAVLRRDRPDRPERAQRPVLPEGQGRPASPSGCSSGRRGRRARAVAAGP